MCMSTPRTKPQKDQDDNKDGSGRFRKGPACEFCRKPAGHDYCSDAESLEVDHLGLLLCARKRCLAKREAMSLDERREVYAANRALNYGAKS